MLFQWHWNSIESSITKKKAQHWLQESSLDPVYLIGGSVIFQERLRVLNWNFGELLEEWWTKSKTKCSSKLPKGCVCNLSGTDNGFKLNISVNFNGYIELDQNLCYWKGVPVISQECKWFQVETFRECLGDIEFTQKKYLPPDCPNSESAMYQERPRTLSWNFQAMLA